MSDKPSVNAPVPVKIPTFSVEGSAHAPFLYFEDAPAIGYLNGVIQITLEAAKLYPDPAGVTVSRVAVAHLRMNAAGAHSLKTAIERALLLAAPASSDAKN